MHDLRPQNGISHVIGQADTPLIELTIPQILAQTVSEFPDREAAVFAAEGLRWTYEEFATQVDRLATGSASGLRTEVSGY